MGFFGSMDLCQQMYQMSRKTKYSFVKGDQVCKKIIVYLAQKMNPRLPPEEQLPFALAIIVFIDFHLIWTSGQFEVILAMKYCPEWSIKEL